MASAGIRIVHALPRRLRIRIESLKGDPLAALAVEQRLAGVPGLLRTQANPVTGTVLLLYEEHATWRDSISALARELTAITGDYDVEGVAEYLTASPQTPDGGSTVDAEDVRGLFRGMNDAIRSTTGGLDLKLLVPLALLLLGVRGLFVAGETATPRWYDLLWFGFGTFMMLNAAGAPEARAAEEAGEHAAAP